MKPFRILCLGLLAALLSACAAPPLKGTGDLGLVIERASGKHIPYVVTPRRAGDIASCYCNPGKAARVLGWKAQFGIEDMCRDSWRWQSQNPEGYPDD